MNKLLIFSFAFVSQVYGADYFYCKDIRPNFDKYHYLIDSYGISIIADGRRIYDSEFLNQNNDILTSRVWDEQIHRWNKLRAEFVPSDYNEAFKAEYVRYYDVLVSVTNLVCKRVYRHIGRP